MSEPSKTVVEHCPYCRQERHVIEIAEDSYSDSSDPEYSFTNEAHFLKCNTCRGYYLKVGHSNEHDFDHDVLPDGSWETIYPFRYSFVPGEALRPYPAWIERLRVEERIFHEDLLDIYKALDAELFRLAAMGIRSLFEKVAHQIGISKEKNFKQILSELQKKDIITAEDKSALEVLVEGGHAATHRDWSPDISDLVVLLDIFEEFIYSSFFKDADNAEKLSQRKALKAKLPPHPSSKQKLKKHLTSEI